MTGPVYVAVPDRCSHCGDVFLPQQTWCSVHAPEKDPQAVHWACLIRMLGKNPMAVLAGVGADLVAGLQDLPNRAPAAQGPQGAKRRPATCVPGTMAMGYCPGCGARFGHMHR